jgi:hypothetical protein
MQGVQSSLSNLMRQTNQIQQVGNTNPPNMANVPASLLQRASPVGTSLVDTTKTNQNVSEQAAAQCRSYKGIEGLRRLQRDQANRSFYDAGCGWIFQSSSGINPEMNQGALGTAQGPVVDTVRGGGKYYWDLQAAEKEITQKICSNASKCSQLRLMGQFAEVCGFCKSSGAIIPVEKTAGGYKARYSNDASLQCEPMNIVAGGSGTCPSEGFQSQHIRNEGFIGGGGVTLDDLDSCKPPLTRDCVVLAARLSGCSDKGTMIAALGQSKDGQDYDAALRALPAFTSYQSSANPNITSAIVKDGSASLSTALSDFNNLMNNTNSKNAKLGMAARDLCLKAGEFENYNFCNEVGNTTIINDQTVKCLRDDWLNRGGTEKGSGYATLGNYRGRQKQTYLDYVNGLIARTKSTDKNMNQAAIKEFIGMDSAGVITDLPRDENTRGAETVWIDLVNAADNNNAPIILRCDLRLAKDGEVIPSFPERNTLSSKWKVPADNIAFTSAFEIRPDNDTTVSFAVQTDDGFMLSINQNPFENTTFKMNDWGSWRYQGPTWYRSGQYRIAGEKVGGTPPSAFGEKQKEKNMVVTKWFQGGSLATCDFRYKLGNGAEMNPADSFANRANLYVTQEPLAPWLQYEIVSKPNRGNGSTLGLFEKRWNGQCAYAWGTGQPIWSFDIETKSTAPQSSMGGKHLSFVTNSYWHTTSQFAFTAFKTITLLIRPMGNLANGATVSLFHHINFKNQFGYGCYLVNQGGRYFIRHWKGNMQEEHPVYINKWNFLVIQYVGDQYGIRNFDLHVYDYDYVKGDTGRRQLLGYLKQRQNASGAVLYGNSINDRRNAGHLVLGGTSPNYKDASGRVTWQTQSFTGDVAYIHGFRNYIDTDELLKTEIDSKWISRWP